MLNMDTIKCNGFSCWVLGVMIPITIVSGMLDSLPTELPTVPKQDTTVQTTPPPSSPASPTSTRALLKPSTEDLQETSTAKWEFTTVKEATIPASTPPQSTTITTTTTPSTTIASTVLSTTMAITEMVPRDTTEASTVTTVAHQTTTIESTTTVVPPAPKTDVNSESPVTLTTNLTTTPFVEPNGWPMLIIAAGGGALLTIIIAVPIIVIITKKCCNQRNNIEKYEFDYETHEMKPVNRARSIAQDPSVAIYSSIRDNSRVPPKKSNGIYDIPRKASLSGAQGLYMVSPMNDYQVPRGVAVGDDLDHIYVSAENVFDSGKDPDDVLPSFGRKDSEISYNAIYSTHNTFTTEL